MLKKLSEEMLLETIGLRFGLRFWRGVLRFCLRFPICTAFVCCLLLLRVRSLHGYWFLLVFNTVF